MAKVWAPLPRRLVVPALVALGPLLVGCGGARQVAFPPSPPVATIGLPPIWTETTDAQAAPPAAGTAAPPGTSSPPRATQAAPRSEELLPGGPWVFLCREDGSAVLRDVSGTGQRPFEGPCQPWVAPGGDVIFAGVETIGVWSVPDLTRRLEHALPEGSWVYGGLVDHYVKWSPNGENLLLVIWSPESPTFSLHRFRPGETEIEPTGLQAERMEILG